jgi:response regulator RpfG family c-di-GMP phosphodiesterase
VTVRPSNRRPPSIQDKKVLLVDSCQATREVRAAILREHGVEVHSADDLSGARFLWHPHSYNLVLLDVRRYSPGEMLEFCEQIKRASPRQRIVFLVGPPTYLSLTWPEDLLATYEEPRQWEETVKRFMAAA